MVFISSNGEIVSQRSRFRPSYLMELFWSFINLIGLFFSTIFGDPRATNNRTNSTNPSPRRPPPSGGGGGGKTGNIKGFKDLNKGAGCVPGGS